MPDKLTELFEAWKKTLPADAIPTELQLFQGGFSTGALAMRTRAMKLAQKLAAALPSQATPINDLINAIGSLPDIPEE